MVTRHKKHCRHGFLHSCECWLFLVLICYQCFISSLQYFDDIDFSYASSAMLVPCVLVYTCNRVWCKFSTLISVLSVIGFSLHYCCTEMFACLFAVLCQCHCMKRNCCWRGWKQVSRLDWWHPVPSCRDSIVNSVLGRSVANYVLLYTRWLSFTG